MTPPNREQDVRAERIPVFRTAAEIALAVPAAVTWYLAGYFPENSLVDLASKPKEGKTTWLLAACRAILHGDPFMGLPTQKTPIMYLTEQNETTFRKALARVGLLECEGLAVLFWKEAYGLPWPRLMEHVRNECVRRGVKLLIVDTFHQFAGLEGDSENSAGATLEAMRSLQEVRDAGITVVTSRHERKSGGVVGEAARGSSAFAGAVDVLIVMRRTAGNNPRRSGRVLTSISRFDETPEELVIELTPDGYVAHGADQALALADAKAAILSRAPRSEAEARTMDDLTEGLRVARTTAQRAIESLGKEGQIVQVGKGVKGDPIRYYVREIDSAQTPQPMGQKGAPWDSTLSSPVPATS